MTNNEARSLLFRARSLLSQACWNGMCCDLRADIDTALANDDGQAQPCEHALLLREARTALVRTEFALRAILDSTITKTVERLDKTIA